MKNRDPKGATSIMQGSRFVQNAQTVSYDLQNEFNENENGFYHGAHHSTILNNRCRQL